MRLAYSCFLTAMMRFPFRSRISMMRLHPGVAGHSPWGVNSNPPRTRVARTALAPALRADSARRFRSAGSNSEKPGGLVATLLGRDFVGIELSPKYAAMSRERITRALANPAGHLSGDPEPHEGQLGLLEAAS